jgi:hypothetical protein
MGLLDVEEDYRFFCMGFLTREGIFFFASFLCDLRAMSGRRCEFLWGKEVIVIGIST